MPLAVLAAALLLAALHGPVGANAHASQATPPSVPTSTATPTVTPTAMATAFTPTAARTQIGSGRNGGSDASNRRALVEIILAASVAMAGLLLVFQGFLSRLGFDLRDQVKDVGRPEGTQGLLIIWTAIMGLITSAVLSALLVTFVSVLRLASTSSISLGVFAPLDGIASNIQLSFIISLFLIVVVLVTVLAFLVALMSVYAVASATASSASDGDAEATVTNNTNKTAPASTSGEVQPGDVSEGPTPDANNAQPAKDSENKDEEPPVAK